MACKVSPDTTVCVAYFIRDHRLRFSNKNPIPFEGMVHTHLTVLPYQIFVLIFVAFPIINTQCQLEKRRCLRSNPDFQRYVVAPHRINIDQEYQGQIVIGNTMYMILTRPYVMLLLGL